MQARELMTPDPAMVAAGDTITTAAETMRQRDVGMLPVVDDLAGRHLLGVLTDRDIVVRHVAPGHGELALVRHSMTQDPLVTALPEDSAEAVADKMVRYQVRRLPVVNEKGVVLGVVAQADLLLHLGPDDPSLVERLVTGIVRAGSLAKTDG